MMLDNDQVTDLQDTLDAAQDDDTLVAEQGDDSLAGEAEIDVIGFEGEEPPPAEDGQSDEHWVTKVRQENRELKKRLKALEQQTQAPPPKVERRPRPVAADFGFDDDAHADAVEKWAIEKVKWDAEDKARADELEASKKSWEAKLAGFEEKATTLRVPDFEDARGAVTEQLSTQQQALILHCSDNAAALVYALGKSPETLKKLAAVKDLALFPYELSKIEGKLKMERTKSPPPVEGRVTGGNGAAPRGSLQSQIEAAEKEWERTGGDRTKIQQLKRQLSAR